MNKSEQRECDKLSAMLKGYAGWNLGDVQQEAVAGVAARSFSALARSARTERSRNEIITVAAGFPSVVKHPDFIV